MPSLAPLLAPAALALTGIVPAAASSVQEPPPGESGAELWAAAREVIVDSCLRCHGGERFESGFALTSGEAFRLGGDRGPVVDLEDPGASRLLEVIRYGNPDLAMPPSAQLPAASVRALERWVLAGSPWPVGEAGRLAPDPEREHANSAVDETDWWAYRPLVRPPLPARVPGDDENAHPVDRFVDAALAAAPDAKPAPRAAPETLLRRACFDLTGLPPTTDQRARFAAESIELGSEAAWEALLERLLASPHYGEHRARAWLDLVRYAETNGYERDATKRGIWRYRDWVIRALNEDLPYDDFVRAQLAGDELLNAEADTLLATGYYRLGVWDDEPSDPEQARADELADIVDTTAQVFLATTMGCARCHDHKADPITQRDYYALTAWFNNVQGYGGDAFGQHLGGGMLRDVADGAGPSAAAHADAVAEIEAELAALGETLAVEAPKRDALESRRALVKDARATPAEARPTWRYLALEAGDRAPDGWERPGFDASAWPTGRGGFGTPNTPGSGRGRLATDWTTPAIHLRTSFRLETIPESPLGLTVHHDEDVVVFLNGQRVFAREGYRSDYTEVQLEDAARSALVVGRNVLAVACRQTAGGQYVDVGLFAGEVSADPADWLRTLRRRARELSDGPEARALRDLLADRDHAAAAPRAAPYPALVVSEFGARAPEQHVHLRGSVHAPGDVVAPAVPAAFAGLAPSPGIPTPAEDAPSTGRRLALAEWIVGEGAFLAARVEANRLWQAHFGRGLCPTPGDFGRLGLPPTHPELLDWLAVELIEGGWSRKRLHRLLMTSEAYRRSSIPAPEVLERDPGNRWFARANPRRLTAEQYRDAVLATSGRLNPALFGPSVWPPLPREVIETSSQPDNAWGHSSPAQAARRSVYVFVKRSLRPPLLEAFDQPDPDLPCPARFPTNVPTQALMTLNGDFVHGAARDLADSLEGAELRVQLASAVERTLGRAATDDELDRGEGFVASLRQAHRLDPAEALRLFCVALYNRNEFLWID